MTSTADILQLSAAANALTRLLVMCHVCLGIQQRIHALWERHTLTSVMACCCSSKAYASASLYPESVSSSSNGLYVTSRCKSPLACSMQCLTLQPWYQATDCLCHPRIKGTQQVIKHCSMFAEACIHRGAHTFIPDAEGCTGSHMFC